MSANRIVCPKCKGVLLSTRPIPPGIRLKCPRCAAAFTRPKPKPSVPASPTKQAPRPKETKLTAPKPGTVFHCPGCKATMKAARPLRLGEHFRCLRCKREITVSPPHTKKTRLAAPKPALPKTNGASIVATLTCTACGAKMACTRRAPPPGASVKCIRCKVVFRVPIKRTILASPPPPPKPKPPRQARPTKLSAPARPRATTLAAAPGRPRQTKLAAAPAPAARRKTQLAPPEAPPPPKRSRLARNLVLALALFVFGVAGYTGYTFYQQTTRGAIPDSAWAPFTPPEGDCRVLMPGTPEARDVSLQDKAVKGRKYTVLREAEGAGFFVVRAEVPKGTSFDVLYAVERDRMLHAAQALLTEERDVMLDGHPGKELQGTIRGGNLLMVQMCLVKGQPRDRIYIVGAGGPRPRPGQGPTVKFFDSFRILSPRD